MAKVLNLDVDFEVDLRVLQKSTTTRKLVGVNGLTVIGYWSASKVDGSITAIDPSVQVTLSEASALDGGYYGYINAADLKAHCNLPKVYWVIEISGDYRSVEEYVPELVNEVS